MPATSPRRSRGWYDLMIVIVRCVTTLAGEWMKRGDHF